MARRAPSPLLLAATLAAGILIGLTAGRRGPVRTVRAQEVGTAARPATTAASASPAGAPQPKAVGEPAIYDELDRQYELFRHVNRTFEMVAKAVSPAVVHIVAAKDSSRSPEGHQLRYEETGSGVIVRPEKARGLFVLTNNHVLEGAKAADVTITLHDGRTVRPERFWSDVKADIAVVKLGRDDLPAARLGNSDEATVGSWVLALGSPFGLTHSVSQGIISARNRHERELEEDGVENQEFLQTDAAINPGNSGGPLVNMRGEVIGINTAIASNGGGSEGVGFSIPINLAKWILNQLVNTGRVSRGGMGVELQQDFSAQNAYELGLDRPRGARIQTVKRPSPAATAGFRDGDVILSFNGVDVLNLNHLINLVSMTPIGQAADVVLWRDRKPFATRVVIADRDTVSRPAQASAVRGQPDGRIRRPTQPESLPGAPR